MSTRVPALDPARARRARAANTFCLRRAGGAPLAQLLAGLLLALGVTHPMSAHAGPVEQFLQVALNPKVPDVMLLRYENGGDGVFYTRDGGKSWSMRCATAIDSALIGSLSVGIAGDGTAMFAGSIGGSSKYSKTLWEDDKHGCGFARIGTLADVWLSDIEVDPSDPDVLYAVSSGLEQGKLNGLWKRDADGVWSEVGPRDRMMITRLRIAKTKSGVRMYASALRENPIADAGTGAKFSYDFVLRVSDDGGKTWDEQPFVGAERASFKLEAIDPGDPDTIVAAVTIPEAQGVPWKDTQDRVLVSHDKGATFEEYLTVSDLGGVAFDGAGRVWIGDAGSIFYSDTPQGLWMGKSLADAPTKMSSKDGVQCLAFQPATDTLFACGHQALATVDHAHDGALTPVLRAVDATAFTSCDGVDLAGMCEMQLCGAYCGLGHFAQAPLCEAYDTPTCGPAVAISEGASDAGAMTPPAADASAAVRDAGGRDAATAHDDAGSARLTGTDGDCGCGVIGRRAGGSAGALWLLGLLVLRLRRARRRR